MGMRLTCSLLLVDALVGALAFLPANIFLGCAPDSFPPTLTKVWEDYKSLLRCQQVWVSIKSAFCLSNLIGHEHNHAGAQSLMHCMVLAARQQLSG